jgi:hypothetical protein
MSEPRRALIVKREWLDLILSGVKTWEIRGSRTHFRGRIGLIESGSGMVMGEAVLRGCTGPIPHNSLHFSINKHCIPADKISGIAYARPHAWELGEARRYRTPRPYKHPAGAVIWVKLPPTHPSEKPSVTSVRSTEGESE